MEIKKKHAVVVSDCMVSYAGVIEDIVREETVQFLQLRPSSKSGIQVLVPLERIRKIILQDTEISGKDINSVSLKQKG